MTIAAAPAPDQKFLMELHSGLTTLMDRTKDLPDMRERVIRTDERVQALQRAFDAHCNDTEAEFRRIRSTSTATHAKAAEQRSQVAEKQAFESGRWKGIALACGAFAGLVEAGFHVAKAVFSK